jgi:hypothetical protein
MKKLIWLLVLCAPAFGTTRNVVTYGAIGNGTTNDTAAINSAIAALSSGDTLLFPCGAAGIYKVTSALTVTTQGVIVAGSTGCSGGTVKILSTVSGTSARVFTLGSVSLTPSANLQVPGGGQALLAATADQATSFTVSSTFASTLSTGSLVYIYEGGLDGNCSGSAPQCVSSSSTAVGCEIDGCRSEVVKVASVSGTTVNVTRPMNNPYDPVANLASVVKLTYVNVSATVQNLIFDGSGTAGIGLYILQTDGVTVTNVTGQNTTGSGISCGFSGSAVCGWQPTFNNVTITGAGGNGGGNGSAFVVALVGYPTVATAAVGPNLNAVAFGVEFGMSGGGSYSNLTVNKGGTPTPTAGRPIKNSANAHATYTNLTVTNAPANYNGMDLTYYSHHITVNTCAFSADNTIGIKGFGNYNDYDTFNNCTMTEGTNGELISIAQGASNNGRYDQNWTVNGGTYSGASGYEQMQFSGNGTTVENATIGGGHAGINFNIASTTGVCIARNTFVAGMSYAYAPNGATGFQTGNILNGNSISGTQTLTSGSCGGGPPGGTTRYVAQSAGTFSGGSLCNGQIAITPATFNSTSLSPGDQTYGCGTITIGNGVSGFTFSQSGTSVSPIIFQADTGFILQAAYMGNLPGGAGGTGGFTVNASNIILDGAGVGVIQNTANGSSLANRQPSLGIEIRAISNVIVRGWTIQHIYTNVAAVNEDGGFYTGDIFADTGATGITICNNTLNNAHVGIWSDTSGSGTAGACSSNTFGGGSNYFGNTISDHGWQISLNGAGAPNVYNNVMTSWTNWGNQADGQYHTDGIIAYGDSSLLTPTIYNNQFGSATAGDLGTVSATGMVFCTYGTSGNGSGSACTIFNNLFVGSGTCATGECAAAYFHGGDGTNTVGPHKIYNNTFINFGAADVYAENDNTIRYSVENNIFYGCSACNTYANSLNGATASTILTPWDYNDGNNMRSSPYNSLSFATWQADGFDTHGLSLAPNLNAGYVPNAGSPVIGAGVNLTSLGISMLDSDATGHPRAGTGGWTMGAFNPTSTLAAPALASPFVIAYARP